MKPSFKKILLVTDGSEAAKSAESLARQLGQRDGAEIIIADTIRIPGRVEKWFQGHSDQLVKQIEKEKLVRLEQLAESFREDGCPDTSHRLLPGKSSEVLTKLVIEENCDLLIRYRKGADSLSEGRLGRTALSLLRICPCPVLLVKQVMTIDHCRVVGCVDIHDPEELNGEVLAAAETMFNEPGQHAGVLYCWSIFGHQMIRRRMSPDAFRDLVDEVKQDNEQEFADFLAKFNLSLEAPGVAMEFGDAEVAIPRFLEKNEIELAVMATAAPRSISNRLLGSTIEHVVEHLPCNLLAIKPPGFESPLKLDDQA